MPKTSESVSDEISMSTHAVRDEEMGLTQNRFSHRVQHVQEVLCVCQIRDGGAGSPSGGAVVGCGGLGGNLAQDAHNLLVAHSGALVQILTLQVTYTLVLETSA